MVAASLGQGLGPFVVGWLGGSTAVPPTERLFAIGLLTAGIGSMVALLIRPEQKRAQHQQPAKLVPVRELFRLRGKTVYERL